MNAPFITIEAHGTLFRFPMKEEASAWYELDHAVSQDGGRALTLNADREVYACLQEADGCRFFGIIGEDEDGPLPDNLPIMDGERYHFYDHPETEEYYL